MPLSRSPSPKLRRRQRRLMPLPPTSPRRRSRRRRASTFLWVRTWTRSWAACCPHGSPLPPTSPRRRSRRRRASTCLWVPTWTRSWGALSQAMKRKLKILPSLDKLYSDLWDGEKLEFRKGYAIKRRSPRSRRGSLGGASRARRVGPPSRQSYASYLGSQLTK